MGPHGADLTERLRGRDATGRWEPAFFAADRWFVRRWPPGRLAGFALLNASVAVGITTGFTPEAVVLR